MRMKCNVMKRKRQGVFFVTMKTLFYEETCCVLISKMWYFEKDNPPINLKLIFL